MSAVGSAGQAFFLLAVAAVIARLGVRLALDRRQARALSAGRGTVPAGFERTVSPRAHRKSCDYALARLRAGSAEAVADAAVTVAWVSAGLAALDGALRPGDGTARAVLFVGAVLLAQTAAGLPFDAWRTLGIERRFGFGRVTPGLFVADRAKGLAVACAFGAPLLAAVLWVVANAGPLWWLLAWALWAAASLLAAVVFPVLVAPLFNRFAPLPDGEPRRRMEALLARCGFASRGLFVADGSRRSRHSNAYFTGIGRAKRVVLFDTLVSLLDTDELAAVLAHELGHFKLGHIRRRLAWGLGGALLLFALLGWLLAQEWLFAGLGLEPSAGAGVAAALLLAPAFLFPLAPALAALSRRHEFEADAFAARLEDARPLASALTKLYRDNAAVLAPDPVYSRFHDSHPPAAERLAHLARLSPT